ncbi:hypothetical protein ACJVDH_07925 [Pedobacter sp. AW1-32]|uniref:hypothetical protein n=1 Tax=Pedobacter sp. AW1-32 TaxID=3383026 RepID=UPI003FEF324B
MGNKKEIPIPSLLKADDIYYDMIEELENGDFKVRGLEDQLEKTIPSGELYRSLQNKKWELIP